MSRVARPTPVCPACGQGSPGWLLCGDCTGKLRSALRLVLPEPPPVGVLPWEQDAWPGLPALLEQQLARLGQTGSGNGGRGADDPLPFDGASRRALDGLRAAMAVAVLELGDGDGWPDDSGGETRQLVSMARWLLERTDRIRRHQHAAEILRDVRHAVGVARSVIDQAAAIEFAGECEVCGGSMFARARSDRAMCRRCERVVDDAPARREQLLTSAEARLATRDDILAAAPSSYGLVIRDSTFAGWVKRGRVVERGRSETGRPLYQVGEVLDLARARDRKRQGLAYTVDVARRRPLT